MALLGRLIGGVIALVVLIVIIWVMFGIIEDIAKELDSLDIHSVDITSYYDDGVTRYDAEILVDELHSWEEGDYPWSKVKVSVKAADGTELIPASIPVPDTGRSSTPKVTYISRSNTSASIGTGDSIMIRGMDTSFEGARVAVRMGDNNLHTGNLRTSFSGSTSVTFKTGEVASRGMHDVAAWSYVLEVEELTPWDAIIHWSKVSVRVEGAGGEELVPMSPLMLFEGASAIDDDVDGTVDIELWYMEMSGEINYSTTHPSQPYPSWFVKDGDGITITGMDRSFEGSTVKVYEGLDLIGSSGPMPGFPAVPVDAELGDVVVEKMWVDDTDLYWDASVTIDDVTPLREEVPWDEVIVVVTDAAGTSEMLNGTPVMDTGTYGGDTIASWYGDKDIPGMLSPGDTIKLTGMDLSFRGANLSITWGNDLLGFAPMPATFDVSNLSVILGGLEISNRTVSAELVWDVDFTEITYEPANVGIPWDELAVSLTDPDTSDVLLDVMPADPYGGTPSDTPTIFYDDDDGDGFVSEGDVLMLSGLSADFENAKLEIFLDDTRIGSRSLPNNFDPSKWTDITLNFAAPDVRTTRDINGTLYWDALLTVNKYTPKEAIALWSDIRITIVDSLGTTLIDLAPPAADAGVYDEDDTDGIDVELWFIEWAMNSQCNAGDTFKLTGLTSAYEGATIKIYRFGKVIGSVTLPTNFP